MEVYLAHKCPKIALPLIQCSTPLQEHFCTWTTIQHEEKKKMIYNVAWEANSKGPASWRKCLGITLNYWSASIGNIYKTFEVRMCPTVYPFRQARLLLYIPKVNPHQS